MGILISTFYGTLAITILVSIFWLILHAKRPRPLHRALRPAVVIRIPIRDNLLFQGKYWTPPSSYTGFQRVDWTGMMPPRRIPVIQPPRMRRDTTPFPARPFNHSEVTDLGWLSYRSGSSWTASPNFAHLLDPADRPPVFEGSYREPFDNRDFHFGGHRPVTPPLELPSLPPNPRTEAWIDALQLPLPPTPRLRPAYLTDNIVSPLLWGGRDELLQQATEPRRERATAIPFAPRDISPIAIPLSPLNSPGAPAPNPDVPVQNERNSPVSQSSSDLDDESTALSQSDAMVRYEEDEPA